ncbi:interleukin-27 subunit alpha isoform X2 [Phyllostomus discolor]|uniref:Interleukin-27 subunit alpha isoform X2 n=1 Tax=Phyllostomus discolor TaxID=89673 RepID=A0A7E6DCK4_9CHIR|nr:interleukin-27 subunit alpha isoform X2 [Phyllostomus discolor]
MGQKAGDLGWRLSLLLLSLLLVQAGVWGFPRPPGRLPLSLQELREEFKVSLHLARKLLSEVRAQAHRFAESHLPGVNLDLLPLGGQLPNVSLNFQTWRSLSDPERLLFLSMTLRPFQALLGGLGSQGIWANAERKQLWAMSLDLRDLQRHLRFQVLLNISKGNKNFIFTERRIENASSRKLATSPFHPFLILRQPLREDFPKPQTPRAILDG